MEIAPTVIAGYLRDNVLPSIRVRSSAGGESFVAGGVASIYSSESVDPLQASGGFNSVVELAAGTCRQQAARSIHPVPLDRSISIADLANLLTAAPPGGRLALLPATTAFLQTEDYRGFRLNLRLAGLTFADAQTVKLTFDVSVSFVCTKVSLPDDPPAQTRKQLPDPTWVMQFIAAIAALDQVERTGMESRAAEATRPLAARMRRARGPSLEEAVSSGVLQANSAPPEGGLQSFQIGSFSAELQAPLVHRDEATRSTTRVFADLRRARWTESLPALPAAGQPAHDVLLVYQACFSNWISSATSLLQAPLDLPLTPTLSLVGSNAGGAPVPEITDFEVQALAVFSATGAEPALAVAFDVMPGCHGVVDDVRHFIGPNSYGVISDEFVVDCVFRHRWNRGGFDRRVNIKAPVRVAVIRNGQERLEDALAFGYQDLLTLDHAEIRTDSNSRSDCLSFGGQAQTVATSIRLDADGQMFDASQVGLGAAEPSQWGVNAVMIVTGSLSTDPELRDFQLKAQKDGAQPIACPFAFSEQADSPAVNYARIEGISRHVLILGTLPAVLD